MRKKIVFLLIASLLFQFGISDSVFGQTGVLAHDYLPNTAPQPNRPQGVVVSRAQQDVSLRRVSATPGSLPGFIGGATDVGQRQFGAGESVTVRGQDIWLPVPGTTNPAGTASNNSVDSISIGSSISKNIVMNMYNAGGRASGFLHIRATAPVDYNAGAINIDASGFRDLTSATIPAPTTVTVGGANAASAINPVPGTRPSRFMTGIFVPAASRPPGYVLGGATYGSTGVYFSPWQTSIHELAGPMWAWADQYEIPAPYYKDFYVHLYLSNHIPTTLYHWGVRATERGGKPYTTTAGWQAVNDSIDIVNLVGATGQQGININANVGNAALPAANERYVRPTTIAVEGVSALDAISFWPLEWYVQAHNLQRFDNNNNPLPPGSAGGNWYKSTVYNNDTPFSMTSNPQRHAIQSGLVGGCGHVGNLTITLYEIGAWEMNQIPGPNKLDAAVQLLKGAKVCVSGDVMDYTGGINSSKSADAADALTNALIVLPDDDRVTLRTGGDFMVNMTFERNQSLASTFYYNGQNFPDPSKHIYMYKGTSTENFARPGNLGGFKNSISYITTHIIDAPPIGTNNTVFGVYGNYDFAGEMADIHTTANHDPNAPYDPIGTDDNPGVIEVGPITGGKDRFHIYSGGFLKNFESCSTLSNFTMQFGSPTDVFDSSVPANRYDVGGMPNLYLDGEKPLHILNYGNNNTNGCDANIWFWGGAQFAFTNAFADATNYGPMQVQALSDVEFRVDMEIDATLANGMGNNLYVLSDAGNIVTQKFDITSDYVNDLGQGLITFWAESRTPSGMQFPGNCENTDRNRNGRRGNIFLNDVFTIIRTGDSDADTETNFIAENNIRTAMFNFVSDNTFNDTTNFISRKGDIYMGYSAHATVYDNVTGEEIETNHGYNDNVFSYTINEPTNHGVLNLKAGWDDRYNNTQPMGGGNIYFTKLDINLVPEGRYSTNIVVPYSEEYRCDPDNQLFQRANIAGSSMTNYENHGIIGGAGRCGTYYGNIYWQDYAGQLISNSDVSSSVDITLIYKGNNGNLIADAGESGNIIINQGSSLDFQSKDGFAYFRTRKGDIDLRGKTDIERLNSSVLLLADNGYLNKAAIDCDCDEQMNNIYIQDMEYKMNTGNGSLFIGADNNIKLNYGGLKNRGTWIDPFLSQDAGYVVDPNTGRANCGNLYHCDSDPTQNQARPLLLDFSGNDEGGGVALVASDLIDIYKEMIYTGGSYGKGMSSPPDSDGKLRGEPVAGYGLYIKSQGNKKNWAYNPFDVLPDGYCPPFCTDIKCGTAYLHQTARVTFHDDARIRPENSKAYIASPVLEVFGNLELNSEQGWGPNSMLYIQTDSLILHDSLIFKGNNLQLSTWSNLPFDMPIIKLGHKRTQPPYADDCKNCVPHRKGVKGSGLDTIFIKYENDPPPFERLHSLVADHTVLSFLTDSFDNVKGKPVLDARFYTNIFKVRNQVELWSDARLRHSGHLELISEIQMFSKNYSGIFTRHLHMEPIGPECSRKKYSELWIPYPALDVITSSRFGGFGTLYADVHVETLGIIAPGYASLGTGGNCYEQTSGTLKMQELHMDGGAELHFSIGDKKGYDGWETDILEVDNLVAYGTINVFIEKRCGQKYQPGCYPIILYNTVGNGQLNNLKLGTLRIDNYPLTLDFSTPGVVYLCVGESILPVIQREVILPKPPQGVTIYPAPGVHWVPWGRSFTFTLNFGVATPFLVTTNRPIDPRTGTESEILVPKLNANGEYEYTIPIVKTQPILIYIGPELYFGEITANEAVNRNGVWSSGNTLYINVNQQDIASIYSVTGTLVQRIEVPVSGASVPMQRGAFIVTLKDGSVHKVIIR